MARRSANDAGRNLLDVGAARNDYAMGKRRGAQTRARRGVPSSGASADYHYRNETDWLWMQELAWEIYRNHMVVGSIVDRGIEYMLQDGFAFDPDTGDPKVNQDLKDWWEDCSYTPEQCDPGGEDIFVDQVEAVARAVVVGGDIFGLPIDDEYGTVDLVEGQMCRSPSRKSKESIVHGIEMEAGSRRRKNYWFLEQPISAFEQVLKQNVAPTPAYYFDAISQRDERNVFHVRYPKRAKQTRGLTAFAPLFTVADYLDDIEFLELVHKRSASLFAWVRSRQANFDPKYLAAEISLGIDVTAEKARDAVDASHRQFREVAPGSELVGLPGETIQMNSPNIPNSEHFQHVEMLLTYIGINLGMPLVMVLMDASQGNFSSIRGAVEMARNGFRRNQRRLMTRFHCPVMRFKILKRGERDPSIRALIEKSLAVDALEPVESYEQTATDGKPTGQPKKKFNIFRHWWNAPSWPYIDPMKDAQADLIRDTSMQTSPRRSRHERGVEWSEIVRETREDRAIAIRGALQEAQAINKEFKLEGANVITWRDLAPLPLAERVNVQIRDNLDQQPEDAPPAEPPKPVKPKPAGGKNEK